jgi:DNA-binding transcriptional regulator YhcF (GntR family)
MALGCTRQSHNRRRRAGPAGLQAELGLTQRRASCAAAVLYAPDMEIDPASGWPLSAQLAQLLRELIRSGQLAPGDRVPSEPQLAREHAVSRDTAQRALTMLAEEGLITRRRGVGSIVAPVEPVIEVRAAPGARISARLPTAAERNAANVGMWIPMLAVAEPGWPEQLYPADRVVVVVPAEGRQLARDQEQAVDSARSARTSGA